MTHYLPHANKPSTATIILEVLSLLIVLTAGTLWLAGTFGIFLMGYLLALGLLGLFAWPRRHALLFVLLAVLAILALILNIILRATGHAHCIPWIGLDDDDDSSPTGTGAGNTTSSDSDRDVYCGNRIATFITHGLMILWLLLAIPFALKVSAEKREKKLHAVNRSDNYVVERERVAPFATGPVNYPGGGMVQQPQGFGSYPVGNTMGPRY